MNKTLPLNLKGAEIDTLKDLRLFCELSQEELAKEISITTKTLWQFESGAIMSPKTKFKLSNFFELPPSKIKALFRGSRKDGK